MAGFATEVAVLAVFAGYGAGAAFASNGTLFACFALAYLVLAALLVGRRRRPASGLLGGRVQARRAASVEEA